MSAEHSPEKSDSQPAAAPSSPPLQFRIVHLLYALAVLATSAALMGGWGVIAGPIVVGFWAWVFTRQSRPKGLLQACLALCLGACCTGLLLPAVSKVRAPARRLSCLNNMKQICLALHNYSDQYGTLPPPVVCDDAGTPMHSWRVLILPYIEQQALYDRYDLNEPWDGPTNIKLQDEMPLAYWCSADPWPSVGRPTWTSYVAVTGSRTAWPASGRRLADIDDRDGTSNTVLVVEHNARQIPWTKPEDLGLDEAIDLLTTTDLQRRIGHRYEGRVDRYHILSHVAMCDIDVGTILPDTTADQWRALFTFDDGQPIDEVFTEGYADASYVGKTTRRNIAHVCSLTTFLALSLLPLCWVWDRPRKAS